MVGPRGLRHVPRPRPAAGDRPRSPASGQVLSAQAPDAGLRPLLFECLVVEAVAGPRELRRRARPPSRGSRRPSGVRVVDGGRGGACRPARRRWPAGAGGHRRALVSAGSLSRAAVSHPARRRRASREFKPALTPDPLRLRTGHHVAVSYTHLTLPTIYSV